MPYIMGEMIKKMRRSILSQTAATVIAIFLLSTLSFSADYAVTPSYYDDIGGVLTSMGYSSDIIADSALSSYATLSPYKAVFLNCSALCDENAEAAAESLRTFALNGGAIYASDWAYIYVQKAFGNSVVKYYDSAKSGDTGLYMCSVMDEGLLDYLGTGTIELNLNLGGWVPIESVAAEGKTYLMGLNDAAYPAYVAGNPMLAAFRYGKGMVVYTTFHNEAQLTTTQTLLMEYITLIALTAGMSDTLADYMEAKGYIVAKENINKIGSNSASSMYTYSYTGGQSYSLSFGATWKSGSVTLEVYKPDGTLYGSAQGAAGPISVDVPAPVTGNWRYRIVTGAVSQANEPYVLMTGRRTPAAAALDSVRAAPNPYVRSRGDRVIVFDNVTAAATLKIFTINGELVRTVEKTDTASGSIFWDVCNDGGEAVASGMYIYLITDGEGNKRKGKLAVVR